MFSEQDKLVREHEGWIMRTTDYIFMAANNYYM